MAFYQKYRSKTFSEMVGQEHIVATLREAVKSGKLVHAYLLTGPRGIGKTSTARLLAKAANCLTILQARKESKPTTGEPCNQCEACLEIGEGRALDVVEIDAASHTGVDDVRDLIEKARIAPSHLTKKVYIIDEVHMLSKSAFNALLKTLEEPPRDVMFIMATTEVHKIPATILSRVQRFDFKRATKEDILENLRRVARSEKIEADDESLDLIAVAASGGHRDALSLLEKVVSSDGKTDLDKTRKILGIAENRELFAFLGAIFNKIPEEGLKIAHALFESGYDLAEFNRSVIEVLRRILITKISGAGLFSDTKENLVAIDKLAGMATADEIVRLINIFVDAGIMLKDVAYPVLPIEIAVVKSCVAESGKQKAESSEIKIESGEKKQNSPNPKIPISNDEISPTSLEARGRNDNADISATRKSGNPETAPVPVLEMTKDVWFQIIEATKKKNNSLAALLRDAKPINLTDNALSLEVKFKFHKDRISDPKNCQLLEEILQDVTGKKCKLICRTADIKSTPAGVPASGEDIEKAVAEVFEV